MADKGKKVRKKSASREFTEAIVIAIIAAFLIRGLVVQAFKIPSGSMIPTLEIGDHILVNKFIYRFREPKRGDVIVFKFPGDEKKDYIKRVVGLPGEWIEMKGTTIFVNGTPLDETYTRYNHGISQRNGFRPLFVRPGYLFVMGDNRDNSRDSRSWGQLQIDKIKGRAFLIYFSWNKHGDFTHKVRWGRLGDRIH